MIYGLVPIGGKGTRLGLTFSKEMLPQKGTSHFNPISNHLVTKMKEAGAEKIVFIHGFKFKHDVLEYFDSEFYEHYLQSSEGFSNVLGEILKNISLNSDDRILFGMPDSVFKGNPFHEMLQSKGISCGIFTTLPSSKVDRLLINKSKFAVKQPKTPKVQDKFWGLLKFDALDIIDMASRDYFRKFPEIGDILNKYHFSCISAEDYLDLGTWDNYNYYLKSY